MDGWPMSSASRELLRKFHHKQDVLVETLDLEILPRRKDRILLFSWSDVPLVYDRPRFGVVESERADRSRGGWQVMLAAGFQDVEVDVLDWVLWREALLGFLLPHLRHIPEAADLGLYAGLQYGKFTESDREALTALWKQVSPPQHFQHYIYDGPFGFPLFDQVVSGKFLSRVIPWLNTLRRTATGTTINTATYTAALERWMLETHIPLTEPELQILSALSRLTKPLHQSQLAEELNMSISGLSQHLTALAHHHALRLYHFINLPLIGITPYELLIQIPNHTDRQEIAQLFSQFQYIWFINPIQQTRLHCRVLLPTTKAHEFHDWLIELAKKHNLSPIEPLRNTIVIQTWNFDIYIPSQGWPSDLTLPLHKMQAIIDDKYEHRIPTSSISTMSYELLEQSEKYPIALKSEDFTYFLRAADIHQVTDRISAQASKELQRAGVSKTAHMVYRRRIKQLEKLKVSQIQGVFLLHIGLDTVIQMYIRENRFMVEQVVRGLSVLPNMVGQIFENGNGHLALSVPNQNAVEILSVLRRSFAKNDVDAIIEAKPKWQYASGFESPVKQKNYNVEKREWKWERTTLPVISLK
jgi:hypothetical protein